MVIPRRFVDEMIQHAREGSPEEICGVLARDNSNTVVELHRITNTEHSPRFYVMDSQEQLRAVMSIEDRGLDVGAVYHSHPATEPVPSQTDVRLAQWPGIDFVIVSLRDPETPEIRSWQIEGGVVTPSAFEIV